MCVLLCANPVVREWLDIPLIRAYRQSLQISLAGKDGLAGDASQERLERRACPVVDLELEEAARQRMMKRSAWLQTYCHYRGRLTEHTILREESGDLARDWQKALETITKTWGRLLSLVGLRW